MAQLWLKICDIINKYHSVDGHHGRTVLLLPHTPLVALEDLKKYDQFTMKNRLDQVFAQLHDEEMRQIMDDYIIQNCQCGPADGGFVDHLRWWALGDFDCERLFDKTSRFKIAKGTSALAQAILNDCQNMKLLLSTPIAAIDRTNSDRVVVHGRNGQTFTGRTAICTIPLNILQQIEFRPPLEGDKQRVVNEGQCRGGTKCSVKLVKPVGCWFCLAPYPNPISQGFSDDEEGSILILLGPDGLLV
jgi:pseudooxynicotine oxidase